MVVKTGKLLMFLGVFLSFGCKAQEPDLDQLVEVLDARKACVDRVENSLRYVEDIESGAVELRKLLSRAYSELPAQFKDQLRRAGRQVSGGLELEGEAGGKEASLLRELYAHTYREFGEGEDFSIANCGYIAHEVLGNVLLNLVNRSGTGVLATLHRQRLDSPCRMKYALIVLLVLEAADIEWDADWIGDAHLAHCY